MTYKFVMNIAKLRRNKSMTQAQLADKMGVTQGYISRMEFNFLRDSLPNGQVMYKLSQALGAPFEQLFTVVKDDGQ